MVSGFHTSIMRRRLERGPSSQMASVLQMKNGPAPRCSIAFMMPPPWSSSFSRSSEMMIRGDVRPRR